MKKVKIYISKSKVGNPDDLMQVRHHLSKLDVEILEYTGGDYPTIGKPMLLSADILIVVPPSLDSGIVGKGQYTEVEMFDYKFTNNRHIPIYLICGADSIGITLTNIEDYQETGEENWKSNYGDLKVIDDGMNLKQFAEFHGLERKSNQPYTGRGPMLAASKL